MSAKNRGDRIQLLHKVVLKHFTPSRAPNDRSVLEHMMYACCLEDATYEQADEAFHRLQDSFFDWNEIRVTTISELGETLSSLPDPHAAAVRVKKNLQSLFESRYSFEIDDMIKMNQGKAVQELERLSGMTKFVLGYVVQNALGGHAIPVSNSIMDVLLATEIVSESEAEKGLAPGLERTVPKTKGADFASCLHQLAIAAAHSPGSKQVKAILKEAGATAKKEAAPAKKTAKPKAATKAEKKTAEPKTQQPAVKKSAKKAPTSKKSAAKKKAAPKPVKKSAKASTKSSTKRKPR
ncbi:MAG: hypothetical protein NXI32_01180 [bacterium]|nr:hypothetical protein [bacterium]